MAGTDVNATFASALATRGAMASNDRNETILCILFESEILIIRSRRVRAKQAQLVHNNRSVKECTPGYFPGNFRERRVGKD